MQADTGGLGSSVHQVRLQIEVFFLSFSKSLIAPCGWRSALLCSTLALPLGSAPGGALRYWLQGGWRALSTRTRCCCSGWWWCMALPRAATGQCDIVGRCHVCIECRAGGDVAWDAFCGNPSMLKPVLTLSWPQRPREFFVAVGIVSRAVGPFEPGWTSVADEWHSFGSKSKRAGPRHHKISSTTNTLFPHSFAGNPARRVQCIAVTVAMLMLHWHFIFSISDGPTGKDR